MAYVTSFQKIGEKIGEKRGRAKGRVEGIAKGSKNTAFKTARKMLKENFPIDTIIRLTGLSKDEVQPLLQ